MIHHLTLTTGHLVERPRPSQASLDMILPLVLDGGGPIPGMDLHLAMMRRGGAAYFQVAGEAGMSTAPVVQGMACWGEADAGGAWIAACRYYEALRDPLARAGIWREPPAAPPPLPWVAAWITPFAGSIDTRDLQMVADIEGIIGWALAEVGAPPA
nr:hypothetical protein [uncultured Roseococcus sp.]